MRTFSPCRAAFGPIRCARGLPLADSIRARGQACLRFRRLLPLCLLWACGTDAEQRYADLSTTEVALDVGGYRLRYLHPPWKRLDDDPLVTGARTSVWVGGMNREIVPESAAVLQIDKQSGASDPQHLSLPKYRLEASLLSCSDDELDADQSCAEALAQRDQTARAEAGQFDLYGDTPRAGENDFEQAFHEFMGKTSEDQRYQRIVFYQTDVRTLTARLFIEGNPDLDEREITRLVNAFELIAPADAAEEP